MKNLLCFTIFLVNLLTQIDYLIDSRVPAQVLRVDEENTSPRHRGWSGSTEMTDLKQKSHGGCQRNTLITGQS